MGDGPQDDKTEVEREVPSKVPDDKTPVGETPVENGPVEGRTEVLRQVPARDASVDATTKILRRTPAGGDQAASEKGPVDDPTQAVSAEAVKSPSGEDPSESPTQVVRAVPPKQEPSKQEPPKQEPPKQKAPAQVPPAGDAPAQAPPAPKSPTGPNVDGPPTTVMNPVAARPSAGAKPSGEAGPSVDAKPGGVADGGDVSADDPAVDDPAVDDPAADDPAADDRAAEAETVAVPVAKRAPAAAVEQTQGPERATASAVEQTQGPERAPVDKSDADQSEAADKPEVDAPSGGSDSQSEPGSGAAAVAGAGALAAASKVGAGKDAAGTPETQVADAKGQPADDAPGQPAEKDEATVVGKPDEKPEAPVADAVVADTTVADTTVADTAAPDTAVADTAVADSAAPNTTVPDTTVPADARTESPAPAPPRAAPVRIEPAPGRWPVSEPPSGGGKKRKLVLIGAALVVLLGLGGWVLTLAHGSLKNVPEVIAPSPPKVTLAYQPGDGTTPVSPTAPVAVTATDGELGEVTLTAAGGTPIKGELSPDRRTWTVSQPLAYGKTYTWAGTASDVGDKTKTVPIAGTVTTVKPKKTTRGTINIGDGRVVGIAAPVEIQFNGHVTDRAAVERALKVDTSVPTVGSWAWFQDEGGGSRIRWRPQAYWQPGTKVNVTAPMFGVDYGAGAWGAANVSTSFTIGRSQITKADVNSHQLVVFRDGQQVFNFPASYGLGSDPERNTRNGIHVVSEKFSDKRMVNPKYGYDVMEKFAVRISNNGEFIHANPLTVGVQGSRNITHGCVNLSLNNAKQYFDSAMYGDPVEVTGSPIPLSAKDGDIWDWTLDWDQWTRLSALNGS